MTLYKYIVNKIAEGYKLSGFSKHEKSEFLAAKFEGLSNTQLVTYIDEWLSQELN